MKNLLFAGLVAILTLTISSASGAHESTVLFTVQNNTEALGTIQVWVGSNETDLSVTATGTYSTSVSASPDYLVICGQPVMQGHTTTIVTPTGHAKVTWSDETHIVIEWAEID